MRECVEPNTGIWLRYLKNKTVLRCTDTVQKRYEFLSSNPSEPFSPETPRNRQHWRALMNNGREWLCLLLSATVAEDCQFFSLSLQGPEVIFQFWVSFIFKLPSRCIWFINSLRKDFCRLVLQWRNVLFVQQEQTVLVDRNSVTLHKDFTGKYWG